MGICEQKMVYLTRRKKREEAIEAFFEFIDDGKIPDENLVLLVLDVASKGPNKAFFDYFEKLLIQWDYLQNPTVVVKLFQVLPNAERVISLWSTLAKLQWNESVLNTVACKLSSLLH